MVMDNGEPIAGPGVWPPPGEAMINHDFSVVVPDGETVTQEISNEPHSDWRQSPIYGMALRAQRFPVTYGDTIRLVVWSTGGRRWYAAAYSQNRPSKPLLMIQGLPAAGMAMRLLDEHWMDALSVARTREWDFEREVQLVNKFRDDFPDPMRFDHATPDPVEMDSGERPFGMPPNLDDGPHP